MATGKRIQYIIDVDESGAVQGTRRVDQELKNVDESAGKSDKKLSKVSSTLKIAVAGAAASAGLAMLRFAQDSIRVGSQFEASMSRVGAISQATRSEFSNLNSLARELGETTIFTASQAADGMSFLAMAGFEVNEITEAMPGLLNLAAAGQLDLARAADITSNILTGYNLSASETTRVSDIMAETMTNSNVTIEMVGESMKMVGPVASALGIDIEETAAAIGMLGDAGIQGGMAGTMLRAGLLRVINPSKQLKDLMDDLNISVTNSDGSMKSLAEILANVEEATAGMAEAQRSQTLAILFGQRAVAGFSSLITSGADELEEFTQQLRESDGAAERLAEQMNDNLTGDVKELQSAVDEAKIALYEMFGPTMRTAIQNTTEFVREINEAVQQFNRLAAGMGRANAFLQTYLNLLESGGGKYIPGLSGILALRHVDAQTGFTLDPMGDYNTLMEQMDAGTAQVSDRIGELNAQMEHFSTLQAEAEEGSDLWAWYQNGIESTTAELEAMQRAFNVTLDALYEGQEQLEYGTLAYMRNAEQIRMMEAALREVDAALVQVSETSENTSLPFDEDANPNPDEINEKLSGMARKLKDLSDARNELFSKEDLSDEDIFQIQNLTAQIELLTRKMEEHQQIAADFLWLPPFEELEELGTNINSLMDEMFAEEAARNDGRLDMIDQHRIASINAVNEEAQSMIAAEAAKRAAIEATMAAAGQAAAQAILHGKSTQDAARVAVRALAAEAAAAVMRSVFTSLGPLGLAIAPVAAAGVVRMVEGLIKFERGGLLKGPSHERGGILGMIGGKPVVEMEGGEAVINKRSAAMFLPELSAINQAGGGVPLARQGALMFNHIPADLTIPAAAPGNDNNSEVMERLVRVLESGIRANVSVAEMDEQLSDYNQFQQSIGN